MPGFGLSLCVSFNSETSGGFIMQTEHQNSQIGTYEILIKQGFEKGDIASLAKYLDDHQKKGLDGTETIILRCGRNAAFRLSR